MLRHEIKTPVGLLYTQLSSQGRLQRVSWSPLEGDDPTPNSSVDYQQAMRSMLEVDRQFKEYFEGCRVSFCLPLEFPPSGSIFQKKVWQALLSIPYGQTRSYAQVAQAVGHPQAWRAVGSANARNPLVIILPCHRVRHTAAPEKDVGRYAAGPQIKEYLLTREGWQA